MSRSSHSLSALATALALAAPASGGVLTVAPSGAAYTEIADAVAAASDGDVILVESGGYSGFAIHAKSVSVVADAGSSVTVHSPVAVRNLASTQTAVLSGLVLSQPWGGTALTLADNAGPVRVQAVEATGGQYVFGGAWSALEVTNCADTSFAGCAFTGGGPEYGGLGFAHSGAVAIRGTASAIALHDCTVRGGHGVFGYSNPPGPITHGQPGQPAAEFVDCQVFARGSSFQGGDGGDGLSTGSCPTTPYDYATSGGGGGPGLRATGGSTTLVAVAALGGAGGIGGTTGCGSQSGSGAAGLPVEPSSIVPVAAPPMSMSVPAPAREGTVLPLTFQGPAGRRVILATSSAAARAPLFQSVLLLRPPLRRLSMGFIPGTGRLDVMLPVPALSPGVDARSLHVQAAFVDSATGTSTVTSPGVVVILDAAL